MGNEVQIEFHDCIEVTNEIIDYLDENQIYLLRGTTAMVNGYAKDLYYYVEKGFAIDEVVKMIEGKYGKKCEIYRNKALICGDIEI